MPRRKRTAPGDNTTPADELEKVTRLMSKIAEAVAPGEPVQFHVTGNSETTGYYLVPAPEQDTTGADHAAFRAGCNNASITHYEDCPYCILAQSHTLAQHTAAIMRQPGPRPQR